MHKVVKEPFEWSQEHKVCTDLGIHLSGHSTTSQDDVSVSQSLVAKFQNSGLDIDDRSLAEWTAAVQFIGESFTACWILR